MYHQPNKRANLAKLVAIYTGMTLLVIVLVSLISLFVLGYRIDSDNGQLEQYALIQFDSIPSGAKVTINGEKLNSLTPNKSAVKAGQYLITISKDNYQTWTKTINVKAGMLQWLDYALLVPTTMKAESVALYSSLSSSLPSTDGRYMLIQKQADLPNFSLATLNLDVVKSVDLTIPASLYSEATTVGAVHTFTPIKWDEGGRYVLIKHQYGDKFEWIVMDSQDVKSSKNITKIFDLPISKISFLGQSGNIFYALISGDIRKLDLSSGTISKSLVSGVSDFNVYGTNAITYVGLVVPSTKQQILGFYRDGDNTSYTLKTITNTDNLPVNIETTRYFNEDYVAISYGKTVGIIKGSYPNSSNGDISSLASLTEQTTSFNIEKLSFSPDGQYLLMQSGQNFASYDLEYGKMSSSKINEDSSISRLEWLNDSYLVSDNAGSLTIREFDGANLHTINQVVSSQGVVLVESGRYLYSFNKVDAGYQLQRVQMILAK